MWDKAAFAREVANPIIAYRNEYELTQADSARIVGLK
jgi:DNA-binding XRE family transcriptional regulator